MIFSTLGAGMNFNNLSAEGYAAFVLAIIFSIVSVATIIYLFKHQDASKLITVLTTMVFPVIAVFCWVYLIMNVHNYPIDISLYVSVGVAVGYLLLSLAVAYIIIACMKAKKRKAEENANLTAETEETQETQETVNEPLLLTSSETQAEEVEEEKTEETVIEAENAEPVEQGVVFSNAEKKTFAEQLEAQSDEIKGYFNEIIEYAMAKENTKKSDAKFHTTVKIGRLKLLDSKFTRDTLVCNFMAGSSELKNYSQSEKTVKIKEKPVVVEITSAEAVAVAKNMIDIAYKNIEDAHEEKREAKKAQRKKKNAETTENVETVEVNEIAPETEETAEVEATETPVEEVVEEKPKKRRGRRKKSEIEAEEKATEENSEETTENGTTEENSENSSEENE